jgi:5-oxoprolinase (ATP-hydrolysing)
MAGRRLSAPRCRPAAPGDRLKGPAIIIEPNQTIVIEPGWQAEVTAREPVVLTRFEACGARAANRHRGRSDHAGGVQQPVHVDRRADGRDAAEHRLFGEHQGAARFLLRRVRPTGALVANAPHMPVHLGSMDRGAKPSSALNPDMKPGDVYALNAPYNGGTHLPDITVVTPVFDEAARTSCSTSPRAATTPMSAAWRPARAAARATVDEEGVLIDNFKLVERRPLPREKAARAADRPPLSRRATSTRTSPICGPDRRQREGRRRTEQDGRPFRARRRQAYMGHVQDNAEESVRRVIDALADCEANTRPTRAR